MPKELHIDDGAEFNSAKLGERLIRELERDLGEDNEPGLQASGQEREYSDAENESVLRDGQEQDDETDRKQNESNHERRESDFDDEEIDDEEAILQEAIAQGYNPNYKGKNRKTPEQFLNDGKFINQISSLSKENKQLVKHQNEMASHIMRLTNLLNDRETKTLDRESVHLREALKEAYQDGDDFRIDFYEKEIEKIKDQKQRLESFNKPEKPTTPELSEDALAFHQRNQHWLKDTSAEGRMMHAYAAARDPELSSYGYSAAEVAQQIESELQQRFPHRFNRTAQRKPAAAKVTAGTERRAPRRQSTIKFSELNAAQQDAARYFESMGLMTKEEYIKQLHLAGEL